MEENLDIFQTPALTVEYDMTPLLTVHNGGAYNKERTDNALDTNEKYVDPLQRQKGKKRQTEERERGGGE